MSTPAINVDAYLHQLGYDQWRADQRAIVTQAISGRDTLVIMPTGGGKSLCYQAAALGFDGITLVISPLVALMQDQLRRLTQIGIPAVMLGSNQDEQANGSALDKIRNGQVKVVFAAPERFASLGFVKALMATKVSMIAIDEAHCVSSWGHDFRPDYLRLIKAIHELGRPPVMALTATATPPIAKDIAKRLGLNDPYFSLGGFDRGNITFDVISLEGKGSVEAKFRVLLDGLKRDDMTPAIVYCGTRSDTERVAKRLSQEGIRAGAYHAGIEGAIRSQAQDDFMDEKLDVMVATNAFGMGIDKANIRSVWHYAIPTSLEGYYQEAGRAGRDGLPSHAILLSLRADLGRLIQFNKNMPASADNVIRMFEKIKKMTKQETQEDDWFSLGVGEKIQAVDANGAVEMRIPDHDGDRLSLAVCERIGLISMEPAGGGKYKIMLRKNHASQTDHQRAHKALEIAKTMRWSAYRSVENFCTGGGTCRRQQILQHFGNNERAELTVRCCDVCKKSEWTEDALERAMGDINKPQTVVFGNGVVVQIAANRGSKKSAVGPKVGVVTGVINEDLLDELKTWRQGVAGFSPVYTVCKNETLDLIASIKPTSLDDLAKLKGVGPKFLERHGPTVLDIIKEFI